MYKKQINQLMSSVGDGTGTVNAVGDYSVTPLSLKFQSNRLGKVDQINRIAIELSDATGMTIAQYGGLLALTNGVRIYTRKVSDDSLIQELTAYPILTNKDWISQATSTDFHSLGAGDDLLSIFWDFIEPLHLVSNVDYLEIAINDNLTGLISHRFKVFGFEYS